MNKNRRKQLRELSSKLDLLKNLLEEIKEDEEYAFGNMPESLQCSLRGIDSEDAIDKMSDALDSIDEAINLIDDII